MSVVRVTDLVLAGCSPVPTWSGGVAPVTVDRAAAAERLPCSAQLDPFERSAVAAYVVDLTTWAAWWAPAGAHPFDNRR